MATGNPQDGWVMAFEGLTNRERRQLRHYAAWQCDITALPIPPISQLKANTDGRMNDGDWYLGIARLPLRVRNGDTAQSVSMFTIQDNSDGRILSRALLKEGATKAEIAAQIAASVKEVLAMNAPPRRIITDNGLRSKEAAEQVRALIHELQSQTVHVVFRRPRKPGRIETTFGWICKQLEWLLGYIDERHIDNMRTPVGNLLTLSELERHLDVVIQRWNTTRGASTGNGDQGT